MPRQIKKLFMQVSMLFGAAALICGFRFGFRLAGSCSAVSYIPQLFVVFGIFLTQAFQMFPHVSVNRLNSCCSLRNPWHFFVAVCFRNIPSPLLLVSSFHKFLFMEYILERPSSVKFVSAIFLRLFFSFQVSTSFYSWNIH
jgi:hypothetical protein